jgi:hypothetical protein
VLQKIFKHMKRYLLLPFIVLSVVSMAFAQANLVFSPSPVTQEGVVDPDDLTTTIQAKSTLTNEGDQTISLRWERVLVDWPAEWSSQVCDLNQCYAEIVSSNVDPVIGLNVPVVLEPGQSSNIDVYGLPLGVAGSGVIRIDITDINNQDEVLASSEFTVIATAINNTEEVNPTEITLYPNPTTDYFQISGAEQADRVVIYNIIGKQMRTFNTAPGKLYDLAGLPNGMYLASLVSDDTGILKTFRLGKRAVRP